MIETNEKYIQLFTEISEKLGEISGQMKSVLNQLADHNIRLQKLESHPSNAVTYKEDKYDKDDFKTEMLKLLGKAIVIGATAIASLAGGGSLLMKMFAQ